MKKIILSMLFWSLSVSAQDDIFGPKSVSFVFSGVSLVAFGQGTFRDILHRDFVLSPEVVAMDKKITLQVSAVPASDVGKFVEGILLEQGIVTTFRDGIYYLTLSHGDDKHLFVKPLDADVRVDGRVVPGVDGGKGAVLAAPARAPDDVSIIYVPLHRPPEFLTAVVGAVFSRRAVVVAGARIVITGSKSVIKQVSALLESIDVDSNRVEVSASWVEVARNAGSPRGVSLVAQVLGASLGGSVGTVTSGSAISLRAANFQVVVDALNSDSRFKQISNSRVVGDDQKKVSLSVGDETPTIGSSGKDNSGNAVQNIVYKTSGVLLDVLPRVLGAGRIDLEIDGQISSFKSTVTGVSGSPTLIKRQVKTSVTVADGEVLLIGGLDDSQMTDSSSSFAFLPDSWGVKNKSSVKTDLVLMVSAKRVEN